MCAECPGLIFFAREFCANMTVLEWPDYLTIAAFLILSTGIALRYSNRAGESLGQFFLGGRQLPWYVAGFSMVATTFAADTPLAVNEIVYQNGIAGNWLWWNFLVGGMLTVFFFARYWRRAMVFSDVELIELRYGGKPAAALRGFKSLYLGLAMNSIIIGWVNLAMMSILQGFFGISELHALYYTAAAMLLVMVYSSLSGLWGVAITDFIQFIIAIGGCIVLAVIVVNSEKIGGISGLKEKLPAASLDFFPRVGSAAQTGANLALPLLSFLTFIGVQWWSCWYPGAEPGGGGYVAQRMMSAKDEKNSLWATLFFQMAHYCLRPWPWILVGLCSIVLYPQLDASTARMGYIYAMKDFLPVGLKGLLLVAFLSAYMSTISTQLNWGASYVIVDFFKRFIVKESSFTSEKQASKFYVRASRLYTVVAALIALGVTTQLGSIKDAWTLVLQFGAGLGPVLLLRWYWWRVNVWSEIVASVAPIFFTLTLFFLHKYAMHLPAVHALFTNIISYDSEAQLILLTTILTTISWLIVTFFTAPESAETLHKFVERIQPQGWWKPVYAANSNIVRPRNTLRYLALCWLAGTICAFGILFGAGKIIFLEYAQGSLYLGAATLAFFVMVFGMKKAEIS